MTLVLASWYFSHTDAWLIIQGLLFWEFSLSGVRGQYLLVPDTESEP